MEPGGFVDSRFELESLVGAGGMADVYRAREIATGKVVAVKVLRPLKAGRAARFARESTVLERLQHPRIVRYLAHGRSSETAWLAMEWLDGEVLEARLQKGPLPVAESIALARGAAEALAFAHGCGVLHRDIKPGNLFLPDGRCEDVKVLDFGVARVDGATVTRSGVVVGTPAYLSPEQARGADVDERTDLFSLGCVLYECLTGSRAFSGPNAVAVLAKVLLHRPQPVRAVEPRISASLSSLVEQLMEKDPAARPASAWAVIAALDQLAAAGGAAPRERSGTLTDHELKLLTVVLAEAGAEAGVPSRRRLRSLVERSGAQAEWLADNSFVMVLSGQRSATDQAALAARCALELQRELRPPGISLATGRGTLAGALPTGEVIDRAASLLRTAPGAARSPAPADRPIVLDEVTLALLDTRFDVVRDTRGATLRGERAYAEPSRLLLGKPAPYVGRDREIAGLAGIFAECVSEPAARAVLVSGPPGYGKSRLRQEFLGGLGMASPPAAVYLARGDPMSAGSPFHMLAQIVAQAATIGPEDAPLLRRGKLRERLGRHLPSADRSRIAEFLGELVGADFPDEESVQLRSARQDRIVMADQLRRAFEEWIVSESSAGPLILVLEDLHWGDVPSVRLIDAALRAASERPLLVLALARPEVRELWPGLWSERGLQEIHLGKLSRRAGLRLARAVLGEESSSLELERLVETADGNVFFLEELIRELSTGSVAKLPASVLAMVTIRLEAIDAFGRRVLRCASVFGERFWRGGVLEVLGRESADQVDAAFAELVDHEIVTERVEIGAETERAYAFRHALLRDAAYAMLTDQDRTLGHRLAGEWLERRVDTEPLSVAEHLEKGGAPERAVRWYHRAALAALHGNDLAGAVARVDRAVACGAAGEVVVALRLIAAEAHNWDGRFSDASAAALRAYEAAVPGSAARDDALAQLAIASLHLGDPAMTVKVGEELLRSHAAESFVGRARTCGWVAQGLLLVGERQRALALLPRLEACHAGAGDDQPLVEGFLERTRSFVAQFEGDLSAGVSHLERAIVAFERVGDLRNALDCLANVALRAVFTGDPLAAERCARELIAGSERFGMRNLIAGAQYVLGMALAMQGRLEEADAMERQGLAFFRTSGSRMMSAASHGSLATILLLRGDLAGAEHEAQAAVEDATGNRQIEASNQGILAHVLLARGRSADALVSSRSAHAILDELGAVEEREMLIRLVHAEALAANGEQEPARAILAAARERLLTLASRIGDLDMRRRFLGNVPENVRTLQLASQWLGPERSPAGG